MNVAGPQLVNILQSDSSWSRRRDVAVVFGNLGAMAQAAVPALLIVGITDTDSDVRNAANVAVQKIGISPDSANIAGPQLVNILQSANSWSHRRDAAVALGNMGPMAQAALPALLTASAGDSDSDVRNAARTAAAKIRVY